MRYWGRRVRMGALLFLIAVGLDLLLNSHGLLRLMPVAFRDPFRALVVLIIGSALSLLLERYLFRLEPTLLAPQQITTVRYLSRLVLYVTVPLAMLAAFGVGIPSVVFGGAFLTVILGLAGQTMLSNLLAGIWLVMFHPFQVGDQIELIAWQYPQLVPSFPHEALKPSYRGTVVDINLMYTSLLNEMEFPMVVPNGILVQALIINRSQSAMHRVRVRFDVPLTFEPESTVAAVKHSLEQFSARLGKNADVFVADVGVETYSIVVIVFHDADQDERLKSRILMEAVRTIRALTAMQNTHRSVSGEVD